MYVPDAFIDKVDKDIQNFVWSNKPPKVKNATMIGDIEQGGLKMPSFRNIVKSHKIMWIKRLLDSKDRKWKILAVILSKYSHEYIGKQCSPFYVQVLKYWYELYSTEPKPMNVKFENVWNNKFILIDGKPINIHHKEWQHFCIKTLDYLTDNTGKLFEPLQLQFKYGLRVDLMKYNGLVSAIPTEWKHCLSMHQLGKSCLADDMIMIENNCYYVENMSSKFIYDILTNHLSTSLAKWIEQFHFLMTRYFKCFNN